MSAYEEKTPSLEWKPLPDDLTTSLPFEATLAVVDDEGQPLTELREQVSVSAITSKVCLAEGFEKESMGLWSPAFLPGHYEHGFDTEVCAPDGSTSSLYLKGGNDSNFGMTLRLPAPAAGADDDGGGGPAEPPRPLPEDAESEDPSAFDGAFKPQSVAFYVRTDHGRADAGHFILGESNEVNKRVAQFQFTKDGKMGLLGTQGVTHGATPYVAHKWYHVELRFDWEKREVRAAAPPPRNSPRAIPAQRPPKIPRNALRRPLLLPCRSPSSSTQFCRSATSPSAATPRRSSARARSATATSRSRGSLSRGATPHTPHSPHPQATATSARRGSTRSRSCRR